MAVYSDSRIDGRYVVNIMILKSTPTFKEAEVASLPSTTPANNLTNLPFDSRIDFDSWLNRNRHIVITERRRWVQRLYAIDAKKPG